MVIVPESELTTADYDNSQDLLDELDRGNMPSRDILRMANTAYSKNRPQLVYRAVEHLWKNFPDSPEVVQALWVASQAQEVQGKTAAMSSTLKTLIATHPNHPIAAEARLKLRKSEASNAHQNNTD